MSRGAEIGEGEGVGERGEARHTPFGLRNVSYLDLITMVLFIDSLLICVHLNLNLDRSIFSVRIRFVVALGLLNVILTHPGFLGMHYDRPPRSG